MSEVPLELQAKAWNEALRRSCQRDAARTILAEMFSPTAIEREKRRYIDGVIEVEEFEQRVEAILHGDQWWEK